jgi:hypothetical protein
VIDPKGHATFDLLKRYGTALVNQRGSIDMISSSGELVGLGLRFSPSGAFTSFPALPR